MSCKRRVGVAHFLLRTYEMLETQKLKNLIEWSPCGDYFYIKNAREFANKALPLYFRHRNFQSFLRQLNMYNFVKKRLKNGWNQFQHKYFKRDQKDLLNKVHRRNNLEESDIEDNKENQEQYSNFKTILQQTNQTMNQLVAASQQLVMQQKLIVDTQQMLKTKLLYQFMEEQKQEQYLTQTFGLLQEQPIESPTTYPTVYHGAQKMQPSSSPQLFVLS